MVKPRYLLVGMSAAVLAAGALYWGGTPAPTPLGAENFAHVEVGMSQAEVEELLGGPPGNYGRYDSRNAMMTMEGYIHPPGSFERVWCDDNNRFEIYFGVWGRVVGYHKRAGYQQTPPEGIFARLWLFVRELGGR